MLLEMFNEILAEEADACGGQSPAPRLNPFKAERFGPREGHRQLHDWLTWKETPGAENPKCPDLLLQFP